MRIGDAALLAVFLCLPAQAMDNGQYKDVPEHIRSWFKGVRGKNGIPCCDIADGHQTTWRPAQDGSDRYEVPIEGEWVMVPPDAVVRGAGNPVGEAVVWYSHYNSGIFIRCFVPASGA